jgi:hypothetical protein
MKSLEVAYIALGPLLPGGEIVILFTNEDTASKVIERGVLRAFKYRTGETKHVARNLKCQFCTVPWLEECIYQFQFFRDIVGEMLLGFDDAVLLGNEANKNGKFEVAECLHFKSEPIINLIHVGLVGRFACGVGIGE